MRQQEILRQTNEEQAAVNVSPSTGGQHSQTVASRETGRPPSRGSESTLARDVTTSLGTPLSVKSETTDEGSGAASSLSSDYKLYMSNIVTRDECKEINPSESRRRGQLNNRKNVHDSSKVIEHLTSLSEHHQKFGVMGNLLPIICSNAKNLVKDRKDALSVFEDNDNVMLLSMLRQKIPKLRDNFSSIIVDKIEYSLESLSEEIEASKNANSFLGLDISAIARSTEGKNADDISRFVHRVLQFEGKTLPSAEQMHNIGMAVATKHFKMSARYGCSSNAQSVGRKRQNIPLLPVKPYDHTKDLCEIDRANTTLNKPSESHPLPLTANTSIPPPPIPPLITKKAPTIRGILSYKEVTSSGSVPMTGPDGNISNPSQLSLESPPSNMPASNMIPRLPSSRNPLPLLTRPPLNARSTIRPPGDHNFLNEPPTRLGIHSRPPLLKTPTPPIFGNNQPPFLGTKPPLSKKPSLLATKPPLLGIKPTLSRTKPLPHELQSAPSDVANSPLLSKNVSHLLENLTGTFRQENPPTIPNLKNSSRPQVNLAAVQGNSTRPRSENHSVLNCAPQKKQSRFDNPSPVFNNSNRPNSSVSLRNISGSKPSKFPSNNASLAGVNLTNRNDNEDTNVASQLFSSSGDVDLRMVNPNQEHFEKVFKIPDAFGLSNEPAAGKTEGNIASTSTFDSRTRDCLNARDRTEEILANEIAKLNKKRKFLGPYGPEKTFFEQTSISSSEEDFSYDLEAAKDSKSTYTPVDVDLRQNHPSHAPIIDITGQNDSVLGNAFSNESFYSSISDQSINSNEANIYNRPNSSEHPSDGCKNAPGSSIKVEKNLDLSIIPPPPRPPSLENYNAPTDTPASPDPEPKDDSSPRVIPSSKSDLSRSYLSPIIANLEYRNSPERDIPEFTVIKTPESGQTQSSSPTILSSHVADNSFDEPSPRSIMKPPRSTKRKEWKMPEKSSLLPPPSPWQSLSTKNDEMEFSNGRLVRRNSMDRGHSSTPSTPVHTHSFFHNHQKLVSFPSQSVRSKSVGTSSQEIIKSDVIQALDQELADPLSMSYDNEMMVVDLDENASSKDTKAPPSSCGPSHRNNLSPAPEVVSLDDSEEGNRNDNRTSSRDDDALNIDDMVQLLKKFDELEEEEQNAFSMFLLDLKEKDPIAIEELYKRAKID